MPGKRSVLNFLLGSLLGLSYTAAFGRDDPKKDAGKAAKQESSKEKPVKQEKEAGDKEKKPDDPPPSESGLNDARIVAFINEQMEKGWKENKIQPSANANDYEWIRRA